MPKQAISTSTVGVTNIQSLPDIVIGDASNLKATFDKTGLDEKTYINTVLIPELNGNDGSKKIGHNSPNLGSDNVADALEEVRLIAVQAQAGDILPNSITNTELGVDVKVGSLASLTTTEKSSVVGAINEIDGDVTTLSGNVSSLTTSLGTVQTDLNIVRTAKTTTGSAVALAVDTDGTFDLTRNGNILTVIPNVTNTGSMTINVDGQGAKTIKKANDVGTLVDLVAGDIKINVPTQLVRDTVSDFFVYAPKGGSSIKIVYSGVATMGVGVSQLDVAISSLKSLNSFVYVRQIKPTGTFGNSFDKLCVDAYFLNDTTIRFSRVANTDSVLIYWEAEEYLNVKSSQSGQKIISATTDFVTVSSININKSIVQCNFKASSTSNIDANIFLGYRLTTSTSLDFYQFSAVDKQIRWKIIELN